MQNKEAFKFTGQDAEYYDYYLGPILFEPYGSYLASKIITSGLESVLEIAAGTGRVTRHIREVLPPQVGLVASDISNDMLNIARKKINHNGITFKQEDAQDLSFPDNSFDLVVCQFGMMFLPDRKKGFREIYRVLKPGGKFMCFTWDSTMKMPILKLIINDTVVPNFETEDTSRFFVPFSMHDPILLKSYLTEAGFKSIYVDNVKLRSGATTPENLTDAFLRKHTMSKEIVVKDPGLLEVLSEKLELEIGKRFGLINLEFDLSAFLTTGLK